MSVPDRRIRRRRSERSSLQILEEAFHLLRTVDLKYYWWFYFGSVPFAVAMLYFVADMSRSSLAGKDALGISLVLTGFYFWMRWCQKKFCVGLWETISPGQLPQRSRMERFRADAAFFSLQAFHLPFLLIGLFFAIPLGWVIAMLQNFTVLAGTGNHGNRAWRSLFLSSIRNSHYEWAQNHGILIVFCFVSFFTWINLVATCLILPGFAKSFFGVESVFTISPTAAIMNTTFIFGSILLTYLVVSPMMKAAYTLRCFYAESRETGADLLSRLAACRKKREKSGLPEISSSKAASKAAAIAVGLLVSGFLLAPELRSEEGTAATKASVPEVSPEEFRDSIGKTMEQKKYQWQLSRRDLEEQAGDKGNWLSRRINEIAKDARDAFRRFGKWLEDMIDKLSREGSRKSDKKTNLDSGFFDGLSSTMSFGLIVLVSALIAWVVLLAYRKYRGLAPVEVDDQGQSGPIDLQSEDIVATQLPEDEWMRLAREQIAKGDSRLAVRALFLATLANLGEEGLLKIAKFKSNRDYRLELERRVRKSKQLRSAFADNTRLFERAWYGWHTVAEEEVEQFLGNHELIARESAKIVTKYSADAIETVTQ